MDEGQGLTDLDRALADALDVDVSPGFAACVRRRIAAEPAPSRPRWAWLVTVAAAAAVAVAVGAIATISTRRPTPAPSPLAQSRPAKPARPADVHPAPAAGSVDARPAMVRARGRVPSGALAPAEPEVLVPREEIDMYRRLIASAQHVPDALVVAAPPDIVAVGTIADIPIDPIKIDLIIPSIDGEGDRQ